MFVGEVRVDGGAPYSSALSDCRNGCPGGPDGRVELDCGLDESSARFLLALGPQLQLVFSPPCHLSDVFRRLSGTAGATAGELAAAAAIDKRPAEILLNSRSARSRCSSSGDGISKSISCAAKGRR
jgi:hypothetical protein